MRNPLRGRKARTLNAGRKPKRFTCPNRGCQARAAATTYVTTENVDLPVPPEGEGISHSSKEARPGLVDPAFAAAWEQVAAAGEPWRSPTLPRRSLKDDAPYPIESLRAAGENVLVFDQVYNQELAGPRARGWDEVVSHVLGVREEWAATR